MKALTQKQYWNAGKKEGFERADASNGNIKLG